MTDERWPGTRKSFSLYANMTMSARLLDSVSVPVLYEDDRYLIVDKPYDCRIQNPRDDQGPSVQSLLTKQYPHIPIFRNVHQLDYATSGIYVLALTKQAAAEASKLFRERQVQKTYLAIVAGHLIEDSYHIDQPIADDPDHDFRMKIDVNGKSAQTLVQVLERGYYRYTDETTKQEKTMAVSKVELRPVTGRRHQLRVHLQHIGHPIVGDYNYESKYTDTFRMMLHAHKLRLPLKAGHLDIEAPDPFQGLLRSSPE
ncbi:pseudouridine synthase [Radiomyces spectabilis]|uniref:pseudouridine synthase n=1 Tax=Radiomyces spectabilis TaxID=64574 RepID=UPI00222095BC|nr:pseudouridine synthase [Radiomyces spectabilis]KAI8393309.1 pseudouridine synthase [Radiomyces spectabilis]